MRYKFLVFIFILTAALVFYNKSSNTAPNTDFENWVLYQDDSFGLQLQIPSGWVAGDLGEIQLGGYVGKTIPLIPEGFSPYNTPVMIRLAKCETRNICELLMQKTLSTTTRTLNMSPSDVKKCIRKSL